jgi:hypothetical protein
MLILNDQHAIATYRAYRATALWFAGQLESEAIIRSGVMVVPKTTREETWAASINWLGQLRELYERVRGVRDAAGLCGMTGQKDTTCAPSADLQRGIDCLCPACTLKAMQARRTRAEQKALFI